METVLEIPARPARPFIGEEFVLKTWEDVKPLYDNLVDRPIKNAAELRQWFADRSELESYLSENFAWRYIRMTCDTSDPELINQFNFFITEIQPQLSAYENTLDKMAVESPYLAELQEKGFDIALRGMKKAIEIFRDENIPLQTDIQSEQRKYGALVGAMTIEMPNADGVPEEITLPQASTLLQSPDRAIREEVWRKVQERRFEDKDALNELYTRLVDLRHQVAINAGFANFRDYIFAAMGRFDYTPQDCFDFHRSVSKAVVPLLDDLARERQQKLARVDPSFDTLRPWDAKVDPDGFSALKPFETGDELLNKTITCFNRLDAAVGNSYLSNCLRIMKAMGHLDLESRKGKAPGGYNYPLEEIGVPFIFMNATSSLRDLVTMVHEGGHAVHSFLTRTLPLKPFRNPPMEVAELASMSMELLTMDYWDVFFENPEDLKRAKIQHLESIIETLPWVATIDKFQHWIYETAADPDVTRPDEERQTAWVRIFEAFSDTVTNWEGLEKYEAYSWQKQLHLYEVPFYYIEYGIAQLGAIGVWMNFRQDKQKGLQSYMNALQLGYTAPIREIYRAADVPFDFSEEHIGRLIRFVWEEIKRLKS
ncbi:M3 family oligoendopeptidase [Larkinella terrae]|uniref:M3 family oligoendopeptidase n=1 Tax=Larkinella terrae TaxID=2025311 RepID=A0A7K0EGD4_9BACT|nr:M3 family oligoendopeptidase [Larkinella terrae]MRS60498.1 M3 family oligoendopeptidase [Larkinella terrae]